MHFWTISQELLVWLSSYFSQNTSKEYIGAFRCNCTSAHFMFSKPMHFDLFWVISGTTCLIVFKICTQAHRHRGYTCVFWGNYTLIHFWFSTITTLAALKYTSRPYLRNYLSDCPQILYITPRRSRCLCWGSWTLTNFWLRSNQLKLHNITIIFNLGYPLPSQHETLAHI